MFVSSVIFLRFFSEIIGRLTIWLLQCPTWATVRRHHSLLITTSPMLLLLLLLLLLVVVVVV